MEKTVVAAAAAVGAELNNAHPKLATSSVPVAEDAKQLAGGDKAHYVPAVVTRDQQERQTPPALAVPQHNDQSNLPSQQAQSFAPYKAPAYQESALPQYDYNAYNQTTTIESTYAMLHAQHTSFVQYTSDHDIHYNPSCIPHLSWREWAESAREYSANNPAGQAYIPTSDSIMTLENSNNNVTQELHQAGYTLGPGSSAVHQIPSSTDGAGAFSNAIPDVHFHAAMAEQSWTPSNGDRPLDNTHQPPASHEQQSQHQR